MPVTRTERTTQRKRREQADTSTYQQQLQQLKVERDSELAKVHADRDAAQRQLTETHRAAVRGIWDRFHDSTRKLRDKHLKGNT